MVLIHTSREEEGSPPKVTYIFIILKCKLTQIKFTKYHDLHGKIDEYVNINHCNSICIIT